MGERLRHPGLLAPLLRSVFPALWAVTRKDGVGQGVFIRKSQAWHSDSVSPFGTELLDSSVLQTPPHSLIVFPGQGRELGAGRPQEAAELSPGSGGWRLRGEQRLGCVGYSHFYPGGLAGQGGGSYPSLASACG